MTDLQENHVYPDRHENPPLQLDSNGLMRVFSRFLHHVAHLLREGMPEEQARGQLHADYRQHCIMTLNARSIMALLDRRSKKDAQMEIQIMADMLFRLFKIYLPKVGLWYEKIRLNRAILAP